MRAGNSKPKRCRFGAVRLTETGGCGAHAHGGRETLRGHIIKSCCLGDGQSDVLQAQRDLTETGAPGVSVHRQLHARTKAMSPKTCLHAQVLESRRWAQAGQRSHHGRQGRGRQVARLRRVDARGSQGHCPADTCKQILLLMRGRKQTVGFATFLHVLHRMDEPARLPPHTGAGLGELEARLWTRAQLRRVVGKGAVCPHLAFVRPPELAHARELHGFLLLGFGHAARRATSQLQYRTTGRSQKLQHDRRKCTAFRSACSLATMINHAMQHRLARALILASPLLCFGSDVCTCQTGIKHLRTGAKMIDRIVAREMREHLTGSCIVACHGSTASPEKTKLRSSAWEVVVPRCVSSECWSKESTGKAWRHTSEVSLGTVAGGWEWKPSLHLRKNNHQRNFYCRFSSRHDADGYAKTWEILQCLVCPGAKRQKTNWKQAQHLVNHIRLGSAALLRG